MSCCSRSAIGAIMGLVALTALGMNWTEDDTVKTTMNGISNITFIERRHACRTEVLKNGDGRTHLFFASPLVGQTGRGGFFGLTMSDLSLCHSLGASKANVLVCNEEREGTTNGRVKVR